MEEEKAEEEKEEESDGADSMEVEDESDVVSGK